MLELPRGYKKMVINQIQNNLEQKYEIPKHTQTIEENDYHVIEMKLKKK